MINVNDLLRSRLRVNVEQAVQTQSKVFQRWMNSVLSRRQLSVEQIPHDLQDGIAYANLLEILTNKSVGKTTKRWTTHSLQHNTEENPPLTLMERLDNMCVVISFLENEENFTNMVNLTANTLCKDSTLKEHLGLIWRMILRYIVSKGNENETKTISEFKSELLIWVNSKINNNDDNNIVKNFTSSFNSNHNIIPMLCKSIFNELNINIAVDNIDVQSSLSLLEEELHFPSLMDATDVGEDEQSMITFLAILKQICEAAVTSKSGYTLTTGKDITEISKIVTKIDDNKMNSIVNKSDILSTTTEVDSNKSNIISLSSSSSSDVADSSSASSSSSLSTSTTSNMSETTDVNLRALLQQRRKERYIYQADVEVSIRFVSSSDTVHNNNQYNQHHNHQNTLNSDAIGADYLCLQDSTPTQCEKGKLWTNKLSRRAGGHPAAVWKITNNIQIPGSVFITDCRGWYLSTSSTGVVFCSPECTEQAVWRIEYGETQALRSVYFNNQKLCTLILKNRTVIGVTDEEGDSQVALSTRLEMVSPFVFGALYLKESGFLGKTTFKKGFWSFNGDLFCYWKTAKDYKSLVVMASRDHSHILEECHVVLLPIQMLYVTMKLYDFLRFSLTCENKTMGKNVLRTFEFKCNTKDECTFWIKNFRRRGVLMKVETAKNEIAEITTNVPVAIVEHIDSKKQQEERINQTSTSSRKRGRTELINTTNNNNNQNNNITTSQQQQQQQQQTNKQQIDNNISSSSSLERAIALYQYIALDTTQASFVAGDELVILDQVHPDWYNVCVVATGVEGYAPANYMRMIVGTDARMVKKPRVVVAPPVIQSVVVQAKFDYAVQDPLTNSNQFSFKKGDRFRITPGANAEFPEWYYATVLNSNGNIPGQQGYIPAAYVAIVE